MEGSTISYYRILEQLGSGGMGVVYKAQDTRLDRIVALKFLPQHLSFDEEAKLRFTREAKTASALDHPNICTIFEIGEHEGQTFIAMAYYEGETLKDRIESGPLGIEEAIDYATQMAEGLAQSHEKGIVHRDVKPANVLVTTQGTVKLLDFGLAKAAEQTQLTKEGATLGTIAYMSPEQARGETTDGRTDLWALGAVFFELLTGERAFRGVYDQAIIYSILNEDPLPITRLRSDASTDLEQIIARLLAKNRTLRYQTAGELLNDLTTLHQGDSSKPVYANVTVEEAGAAETMVVEAIAVLPFETLGRLESSPFTEGIHGDVLTRLSNISDLRVISRTSVRQYRNTEKTIPEIGRELGVKWLLEGDVQEAGGQVRVNARLVETQEDRQVWAKDYQEELTAENVFLIQGEITKKIVRALEIQLTPEEQQRIEQVPTENLVAYRLYVQGRVFLNERTEQGMRRAADYFQRAIEEDSSYARAWVGRADALTLLHDYGYETTEDVLSLSEEAIQQALTVDPTLAEAYASLGLLHSTRHDGPKSIRELKRAVKLQPSYADAHNWLGWVHMVLGHPKEAVESARRAVELDPLSPETISNVALSNLISGKTEDALIAARRDYELQSPWTTGRFNEGLALYDLGRFSEAITVFKDLEVEWAGSGPQTALALAYVASGSLAEARSFLNDFEGTGDLFAAGMIYAAMGENDAAFDAIQKTREWNAWRCLAIRFLFRDVWGPLTSDPRYIALIREADRAWQVETSGN
ncbi:MAG: hypothetical protein BMS9Abin05_0478 [Rhodothermia bacterium]|nr:MAG: hypothetical protein BMS9Abin05_0478 [Rhodothermia bacterium]